MRITALLLFALTILLVSPAAAAELQFRDQELNTRLTVGYAVRLLDMNQDGRLDIVIVDSERIVWLESPNWDEHTLIQGQTKPDNVCFAPHDIDGDGLLDFAVGADWNPANTKSGGTIQWIRQRLGPTWTMHPIGEEPTVHRMRWSDIDGDGQKDLIVVPLMGRDTTKPNFQENGVRVLAYRIPKDPVKGPWVPEVITDQWHVTHNFWPTDLNHDGRMDMLLVSFEGVILLERQKDGTWKNTRIGAGDQASSPNRGASEIKHGRLATGGDYIATIEPWHGNQVVVYTKPAGPRPATGEWLWNRQVLDEQLLWGHGVSCANLDDDDDEELIIGVRDDKDANNPEARRGLRIYDPQDATATSWKRLIVDPGSVAIEDLAAGDLNDDGRADVVAVGRQTHNVKIYWNETK